jgi:peptidoglycan DL-endopeptidase CwlO
MEARLFRTALAVLFYRPTKGNLLKIRSAAARAALTITLGITALSSIPTAAFADTSEELQAKLDSANAHLEELYAEAETLSEQVNETQVNLDATNQEIETKQAELSEAQDTLAERVASNYKTGGVSIISILFDSTSFDDLISRVTYASKVSDSDAQVIQQVKDIQAELTTKQAEQEQLLSDQQTQQAELDSKVAESESYVSSLDQQVQEALAEEQAAREAEEKAAAEAAQKASEEAAAAAGTTENTTTENTNTNTNTNNSTSNNTSNNNYNYSGGSSSGSLTSAQRSAIVSYAYAALGAGYSYGAEGPDAYDCSGLVHMAYAAAGVYAPHSSASIGGMTVTTNPQPGDICWRSGHVGIYVGDGMMIDAANVRVGVRYAAVEAGMTFRTL